MEENNTKKGKKVSTVIGTVVGLVVFYLIKYFLFSTPSFDKAMMQVASKLNETCPVMVDQETRLDNVIAMPDNVFQYNYTLVNWVKDSLDVEIFEQNMQPQILNTVKTNPDMKSFRDHKVTLAYNYKDKDGTYITKISVSSDQYLEQ